MTVSKKNNPTYIVVDIRNVLKDFSSQPDYYQLYKCFPLHEMVQCVLMVNPYGDDGEFFWSELDRRLSETNNNQMFDYDALSLFYEFLCTYLDETIRQKLPSYIDTGEFVFHKWIDHTAVMLQKDKNATGDRLM